MPISRTQIALLLAIALAVTLFYSKRAEAPEPQTTATVSASPSASQGGKVEISTLSPRFRFSAELDRGWRAEYIAATEAINIYDPGVSGNSNLGKSQIFIRYFNANDFQTLTTVNILKREPTTINNHDAVRYEIEKKPEVANFINQPSWRSQRHLLVDIRFAETSPSVFYVIARNPEVSERDFNNFIDSIHFHNDKESFVLPMTAARTRVTKKPFGIYITPQDSPVQPEKFTGYHSGTDFETFPSEASEDTAVFAICGGPLVSKRTASGYGGLAVQECIIENQPVQVIYGHLKLSSVSKNAGQYIAPATQFAVLGTGNSAETDGERKHLHLGIHKGAAANIKGYVSTQAELSTWINPLDVIPR